MDLIMAGLDYAKAPIELREKLSFSKSQAGVLAADIRQNTPGVAGCVVISTCNRTEIYLSLEGERVDPVRALCAAAGQELQAFRDFFVIREDQEAARHLFQVAAGLRSQIWGEDQIVTQVKEAVSAAREAGGTDSLLETLFRTAVSAAKELKSTLRLTQIPPSAPRAGVEALQKELGELTGRTALVIGNGKMGRLAAELLREAGCRVTVTLRTYRYGENVVPWGCSVTPYDDRYAAMETAEIVFSATTSPHYTVTLPPLEQLGRVPKVFVDLAIPRDIQPEIGRLPGVKLFNIDQLGQGAAQEVPPQVWEILDKHMTRFKRWRSYKNHIPGGETAARFPLFVDLRNKKAVLVGGGAVACRRAAVLESFGADVTVITPHWQGTNPPKHWLERRYEPGDLQGAFLAVAATDDRAVNRQIGEDAKALGVPVSVADAMDECTFFFPAICLGEGLVAGVVSDGTGHRRAAEAAKAIRKTLEELG